MYTSFKTLTFPVLRCIPEKLENQTQSPENKHAQGKPAAKLRFQ